MISDIPIVVHNILGTKSNWCCIHEVSKKLAENNDIPTEEIHKAPLLLGVNKNYKQSVTFAH